MLAVSIVVTLVAAVLLAARVVPASALRRGEAEAEDWPEDEEHP